MAKFKLAAGKKAARAPSNARAIPCLILIVGAIILVSFMFYLSLSSGSQ